MLYPYLWRRPYAALRWRPGSGSGRFSQDAGSVGWSDLRFRLAEAPAVRRPGIVPDVAGFRSALASFGTSRAVADRLIVSQYQIGRESCREGAYGCELARRVDVNWHALYVCH